MANGPLIENFFLCVGAQKAGTTWLARTLSRHPELFLTPVKEIHYFDHLAGLSPHLSDAKRRSRYRKYHRKLWTLWHRRSELRPQWPWYRAYMRDPIDDAWYAALFAERGGRAMAGEATPEYALIGSAGFRHIRSLAPEARILFIMRNPVTRAWSQLLHLCRSRRLDAGRLGAAELSAMAEEERFAAHADYGRTLDDLAEVFPAERVWLGFYEEMHADREAALAGICAFLGVGFEARWFPDIGRRYNVSQRAEMPPALRAALRRQYRDVAREVAARVGRIPSAWREEFGLAAPPRASAKSRARR